MLAGLFAARTRQSSLQGRVHGMYGERYAAFGKINNKYNTNKLHVSYDQPIRGIH